MVNSSKEYTFSDLKTGEIDDLKQGSHILLVKVDQTPPHLMLCVSGFLFDWSVHGIRNSLPYTPLLNQLIKNEHVIIAIEIQPLSTVISKNIFRSELKSQYNTCLDAIIKVVQNSYRLTNLEAGVIFELIEALQNENCILGYRSWNITSESLTVKRYSREDVELNINNLKND